MKIPQEILFHFQMGKGKQKGKQKKREENSKEENKMNKKVIWMFFAVCLMVFAGQANADFSLNDLAATTGFDVLRDARNIANFGVAIEADMGDRQNYGPSWFSVDDYLYDPDNPSQNPVSVMTSLGDTAMTTYVGFVRQQPPASPWGAYVEVGFSEDLVTNRGFTSFVNRPGDDLVIFTLYIEPVGGFPGSQPYDMRVGAGGASMTVTAQEFSPDGLTLQDFGGATPWEVRYATIDFSDMGFRGLTDTIQIDMVPPGEGAFVAMVATLHAVPAPGAILLGGLGVSLVGWLRRRRSL